VLPQEADEPELAALPRLVVPYNRRSGGILHRQLIAVINDLPDVPAEG